MSKKHFIALADMLRRNKPNPENSQAGSPNRDYVNGRLSAWKQIRDDLAGVCAEFNPGFNRQRWLDYIAGTCGPNGGSR